MRRLAPALALAALACSHAAAAPDKSAQQAAAEPADGGVAPLALADGGAALAEAVAPAPPPPPPDHAPAANAISAEAHALLVAQGELVWKRWTTADGAQPGAAAADHAKLFQAESLRDVAAAAQERQDAKDPRDALALRLLHGHLAAEAIAQKAAAASEALERARAQLTYAVAERPQPARERDLDALLLDEPDAHKRMAIAVAEARAAAALAPLVDKRDAAFADAAQELGLPGWPALIAELHRASPDELAALAEETLEATEAVAQKAVADSAQRNLGLPGDRVHRADLARLQRVASADPEFPPGQGWTLARKLLLGAGVDAATLDRIQLDAEPHPAKAARPLALLIDPPKDVRLSYRGLGGLDEERALLREAARAAGGVLTAADQRWELSQLGDGAAADAVAQLFEELAGDPRWLRDATKLRGEPLDDLVHTMATRRLLSARRAAALVLFEVKRRERAHTPAELAQLYRGLLQRATFALYTDEDASRWPVEADAWIRSAATLQSEVLAAQLALVLRHEAGDTSGAASEIEDDGKSDVDAPPADASAERDLPRWWTSPRASALLRSIWSLGRSASKADVLRALDMSELDPDLLAALAEEQLTYRAPERPPVPPRPDYKQMRDDRRRRRRHKRRKG